MKFSGAVLLLIGIFAFRPGSVAQRVPEDSTHAQDAQHPRANTYVLGPDDHIVVHVVNVEEINDKPLPIDSSGYIRLPVVGRIAVAGLTAVQLEAEIADRLKNYVRRPDVSVTVVEFRSQPVSSLWKKRCVYDADAGDSGAFFGLATKFTRITEAEKPF